MPVVYLEIVRKLSAMVAASPENAVYRNALRFALNDEADAEAYKALPVEAQAVAA